MTGRITVSVGRRGTSIRATGHAAQALFDALCSSSGDKPAPMPAPAPAPVPAAPTPPDPEKIQIGPLDV